MKMNMSEKTIVATSTTRRFSQCVLAASLALASIPALAKDNGKSDGYLQANLVSDLPGMAQLQDTNLVNPWGISFSATTPFWISDNGSGLAITPWPILTPSQWTFQGRSIRLSTPFAVF